MEEDEKANNLMATGGLLGALARAQEEGADIEAEVMMNWDGEATNQIRIRFGFLTSPYIVTVVRETRNGGPAS